MTDKLAERVIRAGQLMPPKEWSVVRFTPENSIAVPSGITAKLANAATGVTLTDFRGYTLYTYAAIQAFAAAAEKAKSVKVDDLSKALHSMPVQTVVGPLTWDKKGDVTDPKYVFYIWKNGTYAEM